MIILLTILIIFEVYQTFIYMYKNYFFLNRLIIELNPILENYNLTESFSQDKNKLVLHFAKDTDDKFIIISTNQNEQNIRLKKEYHKAKKNYINFFRDYLPSRLKNIEIAIDDRIIKFSLKGAELFFLIRGKNTNVILISDDNSFIPFKKANENLIQQLRKEINGKIFSSVYNLPDYNLIKETALNEISKRFPFISKEIIKETELRAKGNKSFVSGLDEVLREIQTDKICVLTDEYSGKYVLMPAGFQIFTGSDKKYFDSILDAVQYLFSIRYQEESLEDLRNIISKNLDKQLQKTSDKLNEIKYKSDQPSKELFYRNQANLLLANINLLKKGMNDIQLKDFYDKDNIQTIKLDEKLTPTENINQYFDKAKNERESQIHLKELSAELEQKLKKLFDLNERFKKATDTEEYKMIMKELRIKINNPVDEKRQQPNFKHYLIDDKYHLYVGKDSKNNDELTTKFAKQNDYWFHARSVSGSHVVLRVDNFKEGIPKPVLKKAASIAAYHSKAKTSKLAPVSYTLKKYVVKKKGMEPGKVNLLKEDVLLVTPEIPKGCIFVLND